LNTPETVTSLDSISAHIIKYGIYRDIRILDEFLARVPVRPDLLKFSLNESKKAIIFFLFKSHILEQKPALSEIYLSIGISKSTAHRSLNDLCRTELIVPVSDGVDRRRTLYTVSESIRRVLDEFLAIYRDEFVLLLLRSDESRDKLVQGDPEVISQLVLNSSAPIMLHAEDGTVVAISKQWLKLTGYTVDELRTFDDWLDRAHGNNTFGIKRIITDQFENLKGWSQELETILTATGQPRMWRTIHCHIGHDKQGRGILMSLAEDVSEDI
jgi:PAS domain S-box-containing protein